MEPKLRERVHIVRQYEVHCYSVCYYLLQNEEQAIKAAQEVLMRLLKDNILDNKSNLFIEQYVKKQSLKESLQVIYSKE